jgi:tRNA(adenine34) deaminase
MCYSAMLLNGIRTFVYAYEDAMGGGTGLQLTGLTPLYQTMAPEVRILPHVLRRESLDLFKSFFTSPENNYWQGSLLADYTLAQP